MAVEGEGRIFTLVRTPEGDNDAWLAQRKKGVGGSDVAAIMGLSKYKGVFELWAEKSGLVDSPDISDKPSVHWGNVLEPVIGEEYAKNHPDRIVRRVNAVCRSIERPWAQASLDYEVKDPELGWGILEIKTVGYRSMHDWDDGVPLYYKTQVMHYMSVTGRPFADVAVLVAGQDMREYRIMRDEEDIDAVNNAVDAFWGMVESGKQPPAGALKAEGGALLEVHPKGGEYREEDEPVAFLAWRNAKKDKDAVDKRVSMYANELKQLIGDDKGLQLPGGKLVWKRFERNYFDEKSFKQDHPDLYEAYCSKSPRDGGLTYYESKKKGA